MVALLPMKVNLLSPDIYEIEDFVTVEQQKKVLEYCSNLDESDWWHEEQKDTFFYGKQKLGNLPELFNEINKNVDSLFFKSPHFGSVALQRSLDQEPMRPHRDYWIKDLDYYIRYGIVIYYNDDYLGGEIEYPERNLVYKPKARSLVMHGGNIMHGPKEVLSDNYRYFSTCFIRGYQDYPVTLNHFIFSDVELHDGSNYP
jgi:hypothetical protein